LDEDHAARIRTAAQDLQDAIREAVSDGLVVNLKIETGEGFQRDTDKTTCYPVAVPRVWRPL
jgi:hypothetical protein